MNDIFLLVSGIEFSDSSVADNTRVHIISPALLNAHQFLTPHTPSLQQPPVCFLELRAMTDISLYIYVYIYLLTCLLFLVFLISSFKCNFLN